jgi:hypothetical protein
MSSSTPEKAPKVDQHIGYGKFKKTKTYIVRVDYEVTAKNIDSADKIIEETSGIDQITFKEGFGASHLECLEVDCYHTDEENAQDDDKIKKIAECIPEKYTDDTDTNPIEEKEDYSCGEWVTDDYEYKKNEDGTDIEKIVKKYI